MDKTYVFEGKTTTEAIEKGLKELKVSKDRVNIKVLESEEKRSFFSILTPRVVKVEMTLKEKAEIKKDEHKEAVKTPKIAQKIEYDQEAVKEKMAKFLDKFITLLPTDDLKYEINIEQENVKIDVNGSDTGYLIGYRGEVLNSLQNILTNIASQGVNGKVKILLNIDGYREKRRKDLENLADKIARSVVRTRKSITIEPMSAYERKIIHLKLQENERVSTHSVGEEPYRKIVVSLKK